MLVDRVPDGADDLAPVRRQLVKVTPHLDQIPLDEPARGSTATGR